MRKTMLWRALLLLALVPGSVGAQTIFKCAVKGRATVYQSQPCPRTSNTVAVLQYAPGYQPLAPPQQQPATTTSPSTPRRQQVAQVHSIPLGTDNLCAATKAQRDRWERAVGLSRKIEDIQRWNERVQKACM